MKTNKQRIYDFIVTYSNENSEDQSQITTSFLSQQLNMQRSNVSSILNKLVEEKKIIKTNGRPVLYSIPPITSVDTSNPDFSNLIGFDGSLSEVIKVVKAALLFSTRIPKIIVKANKGSGSETLARSAYNFAKSENVIKNNAQFITFDSEFYELKDLEDLLLSKDGYLEKANNGFLLIKNGQVLPIALLNKLYKQVLNEKYNLIIMLQVSKNYERLDIIRLEDTFTVEVPDLDERGFKERFQFIEMFTRLEALRINKSIKINYGLMQSLMLFPCKHNQTTLKSVILQGIANGNVHSQNQDTIELEMSDLPVDVRKGLIYLKQFSKQLKEVIEDNTNYTFTKDNTYTNIQKNDDKDIYHKIDSKRKALLNVSNNGVDDYVFNNLEDDINNYLTSLTKGIDDDKLNKIVSTKLVDIVNNFVLDAGKKFHHVYSKKIIYGICLHINKALTNNHKHQRFSNGKIMDIIDDYNEEYLLTRRFIKKVEDAFNVKFNIDETILVTLFITISLKTENKKDVITILAMHGSSTATSMADAVKSLLNTDNIFGFNLQLDLDMEQAYQQLKEVIVSKNVGKGVLVIYDMGSIKVMLDSIHEETHIDIKSIEIPITLLAMSASKQASDGHDIEDIYNHLLQTSVDTPYIRNQIHKDIIITLSSSNDIKEYLLSLSDGNEYEILNFNSDDKQEIINYINTINTRGKIVGIVGRVNPEIYNLDFINFDEIDHNKLMVKELFEEDLDFDVLEYLDDQFDTFNRKDLEVTLLPIQSKLEKLINKKLDDNASIGLLVHIACMIDRKLRHQTPSVNFNASSIIAKYPDLISDIESILKPLESYFDIRISNSDIATIITIIK